MQLIEQTLDAVNLGSSRSYANMTVFPLTVGVMRRSDYDVLDDALEAGTARVTEVSDSGSVPELRFDNLGERPVLLLDGEELVGAKQNRILNLSILAPGQASIAIPVSCVEAGRWGYRSREFASSDRTHFSSGRASKSADVTASLSSSRTRRSRQRQVWAEISEMMGSTQVTSETASMADIYETRSSSIDRYVNEFSAARDQVGAVFSINGAVRGIDLFDSAAVFERHFPKLIRSYALDAISHRADVRTNAELETTARRFLESIRGAATSRYPAVGLGEDLRLEEKGLSGGALVTDGRIVHLCAFSV